MSEVAHDALRAFPEYITESRGSILVKVNNYYVLIITFYIIIFRAMLCAAYATVRCLSGEEIYVASCCGLVVYT